MKRSPIQRKTPLRAKSPMRKRAHKSSPARQSARGMDCTARLPGCHNDTETVVLCHLRQFSGGGMGMKPSDAESIYACKHCHDLIDGRTHLIPELADALNWETLARALVGTHRQMLARGILTMKGDAA